MRNEAHSEKEIKIYRALLALIRKGNLLSEIRVSDIAREAEIGKGTVYEYVDSKQELIRKALMFELEQKIEIMVERITQADGFYEKFHKGYRYLIREIQNEMDVFEALFFSEWFGEVKKLMEPQRKAYVDRLYQVMDDLIEVGIREGILSRQSNLEYQHFVICGIYAASFSRFRFFEKGIVEGCENEESELAYRTLVSALS